MALARITRIRSCLLKRKLNRRARQDFKAAKPDERSRSNATVIAAIEGAASSHKDSSPLKAKARLARLLSAFDPEKLRELMISAFGEDPGPLTTVRLSGLSEQELSAYFFRDDKQLS